ncbi:hypothetical protein C2845_PM08G12760 [Panicum miliaceum]|uniref:Cell wall hydroxyproline-rich glycoprotein n=1 Tax=Panicum miliaceum TaxID=4540 RepID=A0A3L6R466_PANMI|nr:hypothetical protein C2845_PM08G12760 [Panicum miliaceum]
MGALHFPLLLVAALLFSSSSAALTAVEEAAIVLRQKLAFEHHHHPTDHVHIDIDIDIKITNPNLLTAHKALQALKDALYSDPNNFTGNWVGPDVCAYNGVFCVPSLHNETESAVSTLDMNAADVAGYLPKEIGLMRDLAVLHLNSNRFCGIIPEEIRNMTELYEFDASNNRFVGPFPAAVLGVPKLSYLDIRFNDFDGPIPPELFLKPYDAIFLNNNRFTSGIPETIGKSRATVIVLANNELGGCIPRSIGDAAVTLDQFTFTNNSLTGCLPVETGLLTNATVFDVSGNALTGAIPRTLARLSRVEQLDLSRNMFTGDVPRDLCELPALANLSVSYNFLTREDAACKLNGSFHDEANCMGQSRPAQRNASECTPVVNHPVDCTKGRLPLFAPAPPPLISTDRALLRATGHRSCHPADVPGSARPEACVSAREGKECVGAIDGTHVLARILEKSRASFLGRRHTTTQNVLATVDFDLRFTYVLAGWEGSAYDSLILGNTLQRPDGLKVPQGKLYLVYARYAVRPGFLSRYRGTRHGHDDHIPPKSTRNGNPSNENNHNDVLMDKATWSAMRDTWAEQMCQGR